MVILLEIIWVGSCDSYFELVEIYPGYMDLCAGRRGLGKII